MKIKEVDIDAVLKQHQEFRVKYMEKVSEMLDKGIKAIEIECDTIYEANSICSNIWYHKKHYGLEVRTVQRKRKVYIINERSTAC